MSISPAFIDVSVQPSYGKGKVMVTWQVMRDYTDGDFFVYKSETGEAPWLLLNPTVGLVSQPLRGVFHIEDEFHSKDPASIPHYRLLMQHRDVDHESAIVGAYDNLTRQQYAGVYRVLQQELRRMKHNGVEVWHCIPLTFGEPNPRIDPDTNQQLGVDCPQDDDEQSRCAHDKFPIHPPTFTLNVILTSDYRLGAAFHLNSHHEF